MTEIEQQLLHALTELDTTVKVVSKAGPKMNLLPVFSRIDGLARQLPATTNSLLLHYLHKKSYQKALLFLQGRDSENESGNSCGHVD